MRSGNERTLLAEEQFLTIKFLEKAKELAMSHKDEYSPYDRGDLHVAKVWVIGVMMALSHAGYEVNKKDKE